ncbi:MAG: hypothetical protein JWN04_2049 [Myxococcaceae bacterium]|nr:hypothetical protein [Myxococcaceae bacterium]
MIISALQPLCARPKPVTSRHLRALLAVGAAMFWLAAATPAFANANTVIVVHGYDPFAYLPLPLPVPFIAAPPGGNCRQAFGGLANALANDSNPSLPKKVVYLAYYADDKVGPDACDARFMSASRETPIDEIGNAFAQYLVDNYRGQTVDIVGHSMGGVITRWAIANSGLLVDAYGREIVDIEDVVTGGSPHGGARDGSWVTKNGLRQWNARDMCNAQAFFSARITHTKQCTQMLRDDAAPKFIDRLNPPGAIPPWSADWTLLGSTADELVTPASATNAYVQHTQTLNDVAHVDYFNGPTSTWSLYATVMALASPDN